jgi:hypothetical protein
MKKLIIIFVICLGIAAVGVGVFGVPILDVSLAADGT